MVPTSRICKRKEELVNEIISCSYNRSMGKISFFSSVVEHSSSQIFLIFSWKILKKLKFLESVELVLCMNFCTKATANDLP